jgi:2-polyprenyl-6-methoxyphenol hydroxylase-like FAD-dependent oxidoreductase
MAHLLQAKYLVGCDGGRSIVRKAAGIEFAGWGATKSWLIAELQFTDEPTWGFSDDATGTHAIGKLDDGQGKCGEAPLYAAGKYGSIGWHTFRHTYRSWLDDSGAPMVVQQKLMRHAQISTTMNVYGNALTEAKREANAAVVSKLLRKA